MRIYLLLLFTLLTLSACVEMQGFKPISEIFSNKQPAQPAIKVKNSTTLSLVQSKAKLSAALPLLQIDPGGHKALIWSVAFTRDGRYLVSAGADKLIRVWDLETGRTVRTLRGQIGAGYEGTIYAMALSPDGQWLAAGGWTHQECAGRCGDIRLYNFITGKIVTLLKGHTNSVFSLAFSPDSRYLVSGSFDKNAILWDVKRQHQLHILQGHTDAIYAVAFTPDSKRVVTGSDDHSLRLWQVDNGKLITTLKGHSNKVRAIAISPQDGSIASGSWDHSIRLWDGQSGRFIKTLAYQSTHVRGLSFSPDGRSLLSGVSMLIGPFYCHVYSVPSGKERLTYKAHDNIVIATAISPDGRWAATSGGNDQAIHIWNLHSGKLKQRLVGVGASTWAVGFSQDGKSLAWGKSTKSGWKVNDYGPLEYHLSLPTPERPLSAPKPLKQDNNYLRGQDQWRGWSLSTRKGGNYGHQAILEIRHQNRIQASIERGSTSGYGHRSYTFSPNGETIISGGANGVLTAYNRAGNKLGDYIGHTSDVWAVAVSPDGRLLASASADQTVRLWNLNSRENLLTIFHGSDGEWVAWTPSGHYTASPNGDKMVGWQINRGVDKAADYVSADQVRNHFYRPDIVDNTIRLRSHKKAIAQADSTDFSLETLNTALPPKFSIVDPLNHSTTSDGELEIVLNFQPSQEPLEKLVAYVNGSLVDNIKKWALGGGSKQQKKLTLPLQPGNNKIRIVAKNRIGFTTKELDINFKSRRRFGKQGTLYLVAVGVSEYQNPANNLNFAATDAHSVHDYFIGQAGKLYQRVETRLLADGATRPTAANIKQALNLFKQAKPEDTVILFLSGHGANQGADYYFLPYDTDMDNLNSLIKWDILQKALEESKGRRLLLVDTCHAGGAYNSRLVKDSSDSNIVVISATDSQSVAQELPNLGHGVFTYALLQGLRGRADMIGDDKAISIKELDAYLSLTVTKLTNGIQVPVLHAPGGFKDFVFAKL